jgi:type VI secretion system Hcp family effector
MKYLLITLSLLLCAMPVGAAPPKANAGYAAFIAVESDSAGSLTEGLGSRPNHPDEVLIQTFSFGLDADYDQATGALTGRPIPEPVRVVKDLDALTPLMLTQMVSGATLQVNCNLYALDKAGREQRIFSLRLDDARLVGLSGRAQALNDAAAEPGEELALVYRLLTVTDERTGISSAVSWTPLID